MNNTPVSMEFILCLGDLSFSFILQQEGKKEDGMDGHLV